MFQYIFSEVKYFFQILNLQYTIKRFVLQEIGIFSWKMSEWLIIRYLKIYSEKRLSLFVHQYCKTNRLM